MKMCALCELEKTTPQGTPRACAFGGAFEENFCCATLDKLRDLCLRACDEEICGIHHVFTNDQHYCTINTDEIIFDGEDQTYLALWITWYKNRGRTEQVWLLSDTFAPRRPTELEVLKICEHYELYPKKETT